MCACVCYSKEMRGHEKSACKQMSKKEIDGFENFRRILSNEKATPLGPTVSTTTTLSTSTMTSAILSVTFRATNATFQFLPPRTVFKIIFQRKQTHGKMMKLDTMSWSLFAHKF